MARRIQPGRRRAPCGGSRAPPAPGSPPSCAAFATFNPSAATVADGGDLEEVESRCGPSSERRPPSTARSGPSRPPCRPLARGRASRGRPRSPRRAASCPPASPRRPSRPAIAGSWQLAALALLARRQGRPRSAGRSRGSRGRSTQPGSPISLKGSQCGLALNLSANVAWQVPQTLATLRPPAARRRGCRGRSCRSARRGLPSRRGPVVDALRPLRVRVGGQLVLRHQRRVAVAAVAGLRRRGRARRESASPSRAGCRERRGSWRTGRRPGRPGRASCRARSSGIRRAGPSRSDGLNCFIAAASAWHLPQISGNSARRRFADEALLRVVRELLVLRRGVPAVAEDAGEPGLRVDVVREQLRGGVMRSSSSARWQSTQPIAARARPSAPARPAGFAARAPRRASASRIAATRRRSARRPHFRRRPGAGMQREDRQDRRADQHEHGGDVPRRATSASRSRSGNEDEHGGDRAEEQDSESLARDAERSWPGGTSAPGTSRGRTTPAGSRPGAGANGSALTPSSHGKNAASAARTPTAASQPTMSRMQEVGDERHRPRLALASRSTRRDAHPCRWTSMRWMPEERRRDRGQDRDVDAVEARERRARDVRSAAQDAREEVADDRDLRRHVRPDLRREVGERVPGQQVSGEPESEREEEQHGARDPGHLARRAVRLQEEDGDACGRRRRRRRGSRPTSGSSG